MWTEDLRCRTQERACYRIWMRALWAYTFARYLSSGYEFFLFWSARCVILGANLLGCLFLIYLLPRSACLSASFEILVRL